MGKKQIGAKALAGKAGLSYGAAMIREGKVVALLVAAGSGTRAGGGLPKQFRSIGGKPLLAHAIEGLQHPAIDELLVVIGPRQEGLFGDTLGTAAPRFVTGGATRQHSVRNGLEAIAATGGAATVLIHDAARPFLSPEVIDRLLDALVRVDGAIPTLPVVDTLVKGGDEIGDAVPRAELLRVQTPQAFRFDLILRAHREWTGASDATDDAQVARAAGLRVVPVDGDEMLEKLTYESDFVRAERRMSSAMISRTALGFDVHAFAAGEELWMGGVRIPHDRGLSGHSDADVALHALTDALLGTIGEGDIGQHFPPSDPQWRGAASSRFLEHARDLVLARGGRIDHVDVTIICEEPRIGPHKEAMRRNIAALLGIADANVSIKATTTERLGFTGRREGIAAQAAATVRIPEA